MQIIILHVWIGALEFVLLISSQMMLILPLQKKYTMTSKATEYNFLFLKYTTSQWISTESIKNKYGIIMEWWDSIVRLCVMNGWWGWNQEFCIAGVTNPLAMNQYQYQSLVR